MTALRLRLIAGVALALGVAALGGCAGEAPPESLAPANLHLDCTGEGSPTVVLGSGMGGSAADFRSMQRELTETTRVCSYSRAGLGLSPPWPSDLADPSAGMAADQLRATLEANDVAGPYVMLGWSYGGLVAQAFAARHREVLAGLVLEDAAAAELFGSPGWRFTAWEEGGRDIDTDTTRDEVSDLDVGAIPLIVLTQGELGDWPNDPPWMQVQDRLASLSENAVHVIATEAGHAIHWESEALVTTAVEEVVAAVRSGEPLEPCENEDWAPFAGECREP